MTPKEKAEELVQKFRISKAITESYAKQCALIAVDEILKSNPTKINCDGSELNYGYYVQIKKEIENL
jgi:hypothetical protein